MYSQLNDRVYRGLAGLTVLTLLIGTVVYHQVEKFSWLDSYYFSVITLATVGYGDFTPHTPFGKIFTTFYIFVGVGIVTTFITYTLRRRGEKIQERRKQKN
jgi:hypothetical protein